MTKVNSKSNYSIKMIRMKYSILIKSMIIDWLIVVIDRQSRKLGFYYFSSPDIILI